MRNFRVHMPCRVCFDDNDGELHTRHDGARRTCITVLTNLSSRLLVMLARGAYPIALIQVAVQVVLPVRQNDCGSTLPKVTKSIHSRSFNGCSKPQAYDNGLAWPAIHLEYPEACAIRGCCTFTADVLSWLKWKMIDTLRPLVRHPLL